MRTQAEKRAIFQARGSCANCGARPPIAGLKYCGSCRRSQTTHKARKYAEARGIIFEHFGNVCACCGESERDFLTVDHINNDGHIQRRLNNLGGGGFYLSVAKLIVLGNAPDDLQLLCRNCNWGQARKWWDLSSQKGTLVTFKMPILKVYNLGAGGVNVDSDPLTMEDTELRLAQNAIRDPLGADSGLKKRPGLVAWSGAAAGVILGGIGVPIQDLTSTGLHLLFIGRGTT